VTFIFITVAFATQLTKITEISERKVPGTSRYVKLAAFVGSICCADFQSLLAEASGHFRQPAVGASAFQFAELGVPPQQLILN
jgi:hypothetical protein